MANVKLVFSGTERSDTFNYELECYLNIYNEIIIKIEDDGGLNFICLDKSTAIKFHRELKKQISFFKEEVSNG